VESKGIVKPIPSYVSNELI
jgi:hypothetical protein